MISKRRLLCDTFYRQVDVPAKVVSCGLCDMVVLLGNVSVKTVLCSACSCIVCVVFDAKSVTTTTRTRRPRREDLEASRAWSLRLLLDAFPAAFVHFASVVAWT